MRREAEKRLAQLHAETEEDLKSMRERIDREAQVASAAIADRSRDEIAAIRKDVSARLDERKEDAVMRVVEELTRVS
jgi:hypothetical protein